jgi:hypothetical protein
MSVSNLEKTIFTNTGNAKFDELVLTSKLPISVLSERDSSTNTGLEKYRLLIRPPTPRTNRGQKSDSTHSAGED